MLTVTQVGFEPLRYNIFQPIFEAVRHLTLFAFTDNKQRYRPIA